MKNKIIMMMMIGITCLWLPSACVPKSATSYPTQPSPVSTFQPTITSSPASPPAETLIPDSWKSYSLPDLGITLRYPETWRVDNSSQLSGTDGFLEVGTMKYADTVFGTLLTVCMLEGNLHRTDRYGAYPLIFDWQGWDPDVQSWFGNGCGVLPSSDAPNSGEGVLFARYSSDSNNDRIFMLRADAQHFMGIVNTVRMKEYATPTPSSGSYTSPLCVLSRASSQPDVSQFADLTITEYPIVDAACQPYDHFDSFQTRVRLLDVELNSGAEIKRDTHLADESNQIEVGSDVIKWEFDSTHIFPVGAPSQLKVLRNGHQINTFAIPQLDPGGGPVRALWSWNDHWVLEVENVLIVDGEIQNAKSGYDEMFNWHLVNDLPFYFFRQSDAFGVVYNNEVLPARYQELIHGFLCCDPGVYALRMSPLGARFFAKRDGIWWFVVVEISQK